MASMAAELRPWLAPSAAGPVTTTVRLPGSKSMTARALVLAALADGPSVIEAPLRARDTTLMATALGALGVAVDTSGGDSWRVEPGPLTGPARIDVGLAGTIMRFLPPVAALAEGTVEFDGDPHARNRPMGPILDALRALGVRLDASPTGGLPLTVHGAGLIEGGAAVVDASGSSQFVSGLLLSAARFTKGLTLRHEGPPVPSAPHLRMTTHMLRAAGAVVDESVPDVWVVEPGPLHGRTWVIEPDLSGALPFFAAALVTGGTVTLAGWPAQSWQPVGQLTDLLTAFGGEVTRSADGLTVRGTGTLHGITADLSEVAEMTPVLSALAVLADGPSELRGVEHIRGHETDRIAALATELGRVGAGVTEFPDGLRIEPRPLHGASFETYADHRMAHAAAVIGLSVPGVQLTDVGCTSKTLPEFPELWAGLTTGS
ncbi:3-phosphoshikimate 1-carboxyvinyltransferase [Actinoplanes sp. SE50]|uniref:3-phosphoshikimate 1-carboxyvinyltransferase n=1 Tax=unclassified Actinoplanes TaxID=2626549 RepID=UPI00023EE0A3|nr:MULTISPECIES: 3-phosphoshikimate 1-carboxyvinyltransferase [unclassified Actinoplanes]AEV88452.1 3-phosphoshikimate 1-carboxyvinyltransferase [Actinoplanes sp. SE50/110]ATO86857.1 3-phosphoshikimate 1-carboxyvinyltransferase [Actinoplanes sp. SE50]